MAKPHTELSCAIWAHIRDQGGWWATREIATEFVIEKSKAERYLRKMFERAHLARIEDTPRKHGCGYLYGYIRRCIPLPGQSAEPLETL
jgi:predicted transcriptional regulator